MVIPGMIFGLRSGLILCTVMALSVSASRAATPPEPAGRDEPTIVVTTTAGRLEEPVQETSGSVSVLTAPEIEVQNPVTAAEVVRDLPGVLLRESGTIGESASISLRGGQSLHTLVLLDGVRINSLFRGTFDSGNFLIDGIGQIDLVRGSQSALYGSEAIGGVVNFETRRAVRPLDLSVTAWLGTEDHLRQTASIGGKRPWANYLVTFSRTKTDGQFSHDDFVSSNVTGGLTVPVRRSGSLDYTLRYQEDHKDLAVFIEAISPTTLRTSFDQNNRMKRRFLFQTLQYHGRVLPWLGLAWKSAIVDTRLDWDNPVDPGSTSPTSYFEDTDTRMLLVDLQQNLYLDDSNTTTFGWEWQDDDVESLIEFGGVRFAPIDRSRHNLAYYFQHLFRWEDRFRIQAGVRIDDNSDFDETAVSPKVAAVYRVAPTQTRLRASWGAGFRAPTVQEQFFPIFGNPDLEPEKSRSWEAGVTQPFWGNRLRLDTAFYWIDFTNLIQRRPTGVSNVGKARTLGVETAVDLRLLRFLTLALNYTYLSTENRVTGGELDLKPKHWGNIRLLLTPAASLTIQMDVNLVSRQAILFDFVLPDGTVVSGHKPGYGRIDLSANYHLFGRVPGVSETRLFIKIRNLLDRSYQDIPGFPAPGFAFNGGLSIVF